MGSDENAHIIFLNSSRENELKYAGFWIRLLAFFIDGLLIVILFNLPLFFFRKILNNFFDFYGFFSIALAFLLNSSYFIFQTYMYGATLGKRATGIKVISEKSEKLSLVQVILRETIGRLVSMSILHIGYIVIAFTNKKRGFHDILSGTVVVYKDPAKKLWWVAKIAIIPLALIILYMLPFIIDLIITFYTFFTYGKFFPNK